MGDIKMPESVKEVARKIFVKSLEHFNVNCPLKNYVDSVLALEIAVPKEANKADLDKGKESDYRFPISIGYMHLFDYGSDKRGKELFGLLSDTSDPERVAVDLRLALDGEDCSFLLSLDSGLSVNNRECLDSDMELMWFMMAFGGLFLEFRETCLKEGVDTIQTFVYTDNGEVYTEDEYIGKVYSHFGIDKKP